MNIESQIIILVLMLAFWAVLSIFKIIDLENRINKLKKLLEKYENQLHGGVD